MSFATRFIASIAKLVSPAYPSSRILSSYTGIVKRQSLDQSLRYRYLSNYTRNWNYNTDRRKFSVYNSLPSAPLPSPPPSSSLRWILGVLLTFILPFVTHKGGPLLELKNDVDNAVEVFEEIVDVVEKVAEVVDKVAEDISDDLPEGAKFKKMLDYLEDMAEEIAKDAHTVGEAIDKFQEVEEKVESIVETLGDEPNEHPKKKRN